MTTGRINQVHRIVLSWRLVQTRNAYIFPGEERKHGHNRYVTIGWRRMTMRHFQASLLVSRYNQRRGRLQLVRTLAHADNYMCFQASSPIHHTFSNRRKLKRLDYKDHQLTITLACQIFHDCILNHMTKRLPALPYGSLVPAFSRRMRATG